MTDAAVINTDAIDAESIDTGWISVHLFSQGDLSRMIVDLAGPLARDPATEQLFFIRHWDGGDHLRLRVKPRTPQLRQAVEDELQRRCAKYLRDNPSPDRVTQQEYEVFAETLGQWEHLSSHTKVMYPNNSMRFIPYRREHRRYGHGASIEAAERHFVESSGIALTLLADGLPDDQLETAAFSFVLLTWFLCEPDHVALAKAIASYGGTPQIKLWDEFEGRFLSQRERLLELGRRLAALSVCPPDRLGAGTLARWTSSMIALRDALIAEQNAGTFTAPARGWEGPGGIEGENESVLRVADICAHLVCNRLGVNLASEGYARYLAAQVVYAMTGVPT